MTAAYTPPRASLHRLRAISVGGACVEATISQRAAALRALSVDGVDLVEPATEFERVPETAGATLVPWPNRVESAQWDLHGIRQQLEVTEPEFGHANHGLLLDVEYAVTASHPGSIELTALLRDRPGYPFALEVTVRYSLECDGIRVSQSVRNLSPVPAPFAIGSHPYLKVGGSVVDDLVIEIRASRALELDDTYIPRGEFPVANTPWDLREGRRIRTSVPHAAYTAIALEDGVIVHRLRSRDDGTVELWADPAYAWVQLYIARDFDGDHGSRTAVAIEPMTAPPNAFRTGEGIRWLQPGEKWDGEWGLRLR